ncbi:Thiamin_pyrophosphokinase [Hexamita inflata]|uniref:Thiamin pyrophosphokinase n=1 Tax=Hexamita inflata TaxID=28002 RepID=A0AA86NQT4_9EUKA|nr:Thiamin pyrophosphokinase [Hexamita inflata]
MNLNFITSLSSQQNPKVAFNMVLLNYKLPSWWQNTLKYATQIIVADGGAEQFKHTTLQLQDKTIIMGDFDSISEQTSLNLQQRGYKFISTPDQDHTDCEKAVNMLPNTLPILVLGALGGRFDHSLYNISICARQFTLNKRIFMVDADNILFVCKGVNLIQTGPHNTVGLFPLKGKTKVLTKGLKWDVDGEIDFMGLVSVSNKAVNDQFTVESEEEIGVVVTGSW